MSAGTAFAPSIDSRRTGTSGIVVIHWNLRAAAARVAGDMRYSVPLCATIQFSPYGVTIVMLFHRKRHRMKMWIYLEFRSLLVDELISLGVEEFISWTSAIVLRRKARFGCVRVCHDSGNVRSRVAGACSEVV